MNKSPQEHLSDKGVTLSLGYYAGGDEAGDLKRQRLSWFAESGTRTPSGQVYVCVCEVLLIKMPLPPTGC